MLTVQNVSKNFGTVSALSNASLTVRPREIMGLIGQNGSGKSTAFHSILDLIKYHGTILWNDKPINEAVFDEIGYLPEERSLMPKLTIEQQIIYLARLKSMKPKDIEPEIDKWLEKFAVKGKKTDKIKSLSKGNQQKVQLICTLIHKPKLLILDEPFSGLDPVNADLLKQAILEAKDAGAAIIFSSHDMTNVSSLCDCLTMLKNGEVVLQGTIEDVRSQFGKTNLYVTTDWNKTDLEKLPNVKSVKQLTEKRYLLLLDDPQAGPELFQDLTQGKYIEEFSQQAPTLDEIFRMKVANTNA